MLLKRNMVKIPKLSLIYVDCDFYKTTKNILELLPKKLNKGGLIVFDEATFKGGEGKAADEFFKKNKKFYKKNGFLVLRGFYSENFYKNILRSIFYFLGAKKRRVRNDFESMHFHKTLLKLRLTKKFSASYKKLQIL